MKIIQKIKQRRAKCAARRKEEQERWIAYMETVQKAKRKEMEQEKYDQDLDRRIKELLVRYLSAKLDGTDPDSNPTTAPQPHP